MHTASRQDQQPAPSRPTRDLIDARPRPVGAGAGGEVHRGAGDGGGLEAVPTVHREAALALAVAVCRDPHRAEDAVGAASARFLARVRSGELNGAGDGRAYFLRSVRNAVIDDHRRHQARQRRVVHDVGPAEPAELVGGSHERSAAREAFLDLPRDDRVCLWLTVQKGEDYLRGLENWLKANPNAPYRERLIARSLADDLLDSLGRAP